MECSEMQDKLIDYLVFLAQDQVCFKFGKGDGMTDICIVCFHRDPRLWETCGLYRQYQYKNKVKEIYNE